MALAVSWLLVAGLLLTGSAASAHADSGSDVSIELTSLTPSIAGPDATITLEGRVTNTSDRPLDRLQAMIWRNLTPYTTSDQLDQLNRSEPTSPVGERMYSSSTPNAFQDLYTDDELELQPGDSRSFKLSAKAQDFFGSSAPQPGVYLVGVQVRENGVSTVGRARTYLVATDGTGGDDHLQPGQTTIGTSTLVELTARPTMARSGVFINDTLADEVATGGRLDRLLRTAEGPATSYAVDPNLLVELKAMKSGYSVIDEDGRKTSGKGRSAAASWLSRFAAMQSGHDGYQLPYGRPDLPSLVHSGRLDIVRDGQQEAASVAEVKDLPLLVAPAGGAADRPTLTAAKDLGATAVLLADTSVDGVGPVITANNSPTILSYTTEATTGPGPSPSDTEVQQRQSQLASSYVASISGEPASELGRLRVVSDADQAGSVSDALKAPWLTSRPIKDLLTDEPIELGNRLNYSAAAHRDEFSPKQLHRLDNLRGNLETYAALLAKPGSAATLARAAVARAASSSWRGHRKAQNAYIRDQQRLLTDVDGKTVSLEQLIRSDLVRVESNPKVTLTGSGAQIPVTIVNNLNAAISVQLQANSSNQSRLQLEDVSAADIRTVQAGAKVPVQIPAHAYANGDMQATVQLATKDGRPIGEPLSIQVNATSAGLVGWIIAIGAGIVLLLTVVLRIRQVARERGSDNPPTDTRGDDDGSEPAGPDVTETPDTDEANEDTVIRPRHSDQSEEPGDSEQLTQNGVRRG